jgi:hypothetical protein
LRDKRTRPSTRVRVEGSAPYQDVTARKNSSKPIGEEQWKAITLLHTVRDLLGHSTAQMSLRYAHLAPDQRREAVAKLNEKPILALTLRLQSNGFDPGWTHPIEKTVEREESIPMA